MSNYDYETRGYAVEWNAYGRIFKEDGFGTEESAAEFAKQKSKESDSVTLIQERYAIGW